MNPAGPRWLNSRTGRPPLFDLVSLAGAWLNNVSI